MVKAVFASDNTQRYLATLIDFVQYIKGSWAVPLRVVPLTGFLNMALM